MSRMMSKWDIIARKLGDLVSYVDRIAVSSPLERRVVDALHALHDEALKISLESDESRLLKVIDEALEELNMIVVLDKGLAHDFSGFRQDVEMALRFGQYDEAFEVLERVARAVDDFVDSRPHQPWLREDFDRIMRVVSDALFKLTGERLRV